MLTDDRDAMLELASEMTPIEALHFIRQETGDGTSVALLYMMHACQEHPGCALQMALRGTSLHGERV